MEQVHEEAQEKNTLETAAELIKHFIHSSVSFLKMNEWANMLSCIILRLFNS